VRRRAAEVGEMTGTAAFQVLLQIIISVEK